MLYYSHVNEDNRVEYKLLNSSGYAKVVAVAGSGERVLALMNSDQCKEFHVVDVNAEALFLLELKLTILKNFSIDEYYQFTGHKPIEKKERNALFNKIRSTLSKPCNFYWEKNRSKIEKGILFAGHFEKFIARIRPSLMFFLGKRFLSIFTNDPNQTKWFPNLKWNLLMKMYSLLWIYKLWGNKDKAFISSDAEIQKIPDALDGIIKNNESASCFMMHLIFKGHLRDMKEEELPPSLQKKVLEGIKSKLITKTITIKYHHDDLLSYIKKENGLSQIPIFYSTSDVLSFEKSEYLEQIISASKPGDLIIWRTFLRNRVTVEQQKKITEKYSYFEDHSSFESTRMYQVFAVKQ